ncbi:hypothetical protein GQ43DRAFT_389344 [Delitschia confertaspora ATCC 74209]|uniref:Histone deacetylase interacting domain-containing protein n=1 Tax=Delitschia confertaspora ATCC 74209 TaxID=1513339 RepID=A0A9P4MXZ4_9PLEO|nr:hypothetical protein GQ43DRAFT_389344 [Delitschia confertaspora ATCC 74209]
MNPAHRDGWPPAQASISGPEQQQTDPAQGQASRPMGAFGYVAIPHNQSLPALASLSQAPPQASPGQTGPRPQSSNNQESTPGPQSHQGAPQGAGYSLPGISQTLQQAPAHVQQQANIDRERETRERDPRERELMEAHATQQEDIVKREAEHRERDIRERHPHEHPAHENHSGPIQIHQPVAVAPSARTIHGPNGLLGNAGQMAAPIPVSAPIGGPNASGPMFGNPPVPQGDTTPRMQHAVQPPQGAMLVPFGGPGMQNPMAMGQGQQPILNDALSYLDQVKVQFADHPDVYNRFLDIMKDFKSGAIDTPGVIERVSSLFAGNPNLIQGFNTFLPPGYKIECGTNGDPNAIRVTTPMGTMVSTIPPPRPLSPPRSAAVNGNGISEGAFYDSTQNRHWPQATRNPATENQENMFSPNNRGLAQPLFGAQQGQNAHAPMSPETHNRPHPDSAVSAAAIAHQQEQRGVSQLQNAVSAAAGRSILSPSGDAAALAGQQINGNQGIPGAPVGSGAEKRAPVEFNHAISYVNKIKNRFASQPDIYKQFLEILQTYQRESKPIQDVYAQVTSLFSSAPDLLEDFKQFLPESAAQHRAQQQAARSAAEDAVMLSNVRGESGYGQIQNHQQTPRADASRLPPMGNFAPTPTANRDNKRKRGERQGPGAASAVIPPAMPAEVQTSNVRSVYGQGNLNKRTKTGHGVKQPVVADGPPVSPTLTPALPEPLPPSNTTTPTLDELAFFDRVRKFIGNKNSMNEFLKLCNLYSQDLIDRNLLLYRAQAFIGGNQELYNFFRKFIGEDEQPEYLSRPKIVNSRVSLSNCRSLGPSYRLLPKRERERPCSGRDELCRSVLNDAWASHPTWASEDSGFVAHRKNQFEESLHRIEEERHDYDFNIEACNRTVQQLEPIAGQLLAMKGEDRARFELPPGLGGQSETIYKRVIMKIYGREKGKEVIAQLFNTPWSVIPILLNRLKMQLEIWKAAQREWEKVWREQTQKVFWRSLDHQSLLSKQADKRQFQPKSLTNEIQVRYEEQKRQSEINELHQAEYQFMYSFKDEEVLFDAARLILAFAENSNTTDYTRIIPFIKEFVPLFFGIDTNKFEQRVQNFGRDSAANTSGEEDTPSPDDSYSHKSHKSKKTLLRDVLDRHGGKATRKGKSASASASRESTPDVVSVMDDDTASDSNKPSSKGGRDPGTWVDFTTNSMPFMEREYSVEEPYQRNVFNMYANSSIYCFFRMFVILYERLLRLKENEPQVKIKVARAMAPKPGHELRLFDKIPSDFFGDTSEHANFYQQVLQMFEEQIKGEVEMSHIEEMLRRYYLQTGWQLYSFDRLLSALLRFNLLLINNDNKERTVDIYNLFKKDRASAVTTHKQELSYRKAVEKYAKDADIYRIAYDPFKAEAYVRVFKRDEPTFDFSSLDRIKRWRCYVASFMSIEPTEDINYSSVRTPYRKNAMMAKQDEMIDERGDPEKRLDKVVINVSPHGYMMKFEITPPDNSTGIEYFVQNDTIRSGVSENIPDPVEAYKQLKDSRRELVQEKLVRNNSWMKDITRDDVDERKDRFKKDLEEPAKATTNDEDEDVEMEL